MKPPVVANENVSTEKLCDLCGQHVPPGEPHKALCGLPCEGGKIYVDDEVTHDLECPRCIG